MRNILRLLPLGCALLLLPLAHADTYYLVSTGHTGAQTQIDINHTSLWTFTAGYDWTLGGGSFVMKDGPNTSDDIGLFLWEGTSAGNVDTAIAQLNMTQTDFCDSHALNCQQFGQVSYLFTFSGAIGGTVEPFTLTGGTTYTLALRSSAPDTQSKAYFIKGDGTAAFYNSTDTQNLGAPLPGGAITSGSGNIQAQVPATATPEPGTWVLLGTGFLLAAASRSRIARG